MRTDLDHLPAARQCELDRVVKILFEEFGEAHADAKGRRKLGRIVKIVLYGSYARGDWVYEPHTSKPYISDFDILVIVNQQELTDRDRYWSAAESRLNTEYALRGGLRTPVNFIIHTLREVNGGLANGRYFFIDLVRDGIALYEFDDKPLRKPVPKTPAAALAMAKEYYEEWFPSAMRRYDFVRFGLQKGHLKETAFELHQTTEFLYHCVSLVRTFYTSYNHNIKFLRGQAEGIDARLRHIWPNGTRKERAMFAKLKEAYVKARYSKHYRISMEELNWLSERVEELGRVVHTICCERIAELERAL